MSRTKSPVRPGSLHGGQTYLPQDIQRIMAQTDRRYRTAVGEDEEAPPAHTIDPAACAEMASFWTGGDAFITPLRGVHAPLLAERLVTYVGGSKRVGLHVYEKTGVGVATVLHRVPGCGGWATATANGQIFIGPPVKSVLDPRKRYYMVNVQADTTTTPLGKNMQVGAPEYPPVCGFQTFGFVYNGGWPDSFRIVPDSSANAGNGTMQVVSTILWSAVYPYAQFLGPNGEHRVIY